MTRRLLATSGIALLLLTTVACGGDDDGGGSPFGDGGLGGDDGGDSGDFDPSEGVGDIPGLSDECEAVYNVIVAISMASAGQGDSGDATDALNSFADDVPGDLKDDAQIMADAYAPYFEKLAEYGGDYTAAANDPEIQELSEAMNSDEVIQASDNITDYLDNECGGL
jgi:hypothetical protein